MNKPYWYKKFWRFSINLVKDPIDALYTFNVGVYYAPYIHECGIEIRTGRFFLGLALDVGHNPTGGGGSENNTVGEECFV